MARPTSKQIWAGRLVRRASDILVRVHEDYQPKSIYITENGAAYSTGPDEDGVVRDVKRQSYLERHVQACEAAIDQGVPLDGYFAWSLLDNFEWAFGYEKRFGLVYVDYETQKRTPKESARWYGRVSKQRIRIMRYALVVAGLLWVTAHAQVAPVKVVSDANGHRLQWMVKTFSSKE